MKTSLIDILACPLCKAGLKLGPRITDGDEIASGELRCLKCREVYQIKDGIPELLPPEYRDRPASSLPGGN
jgi:uncharacterized protein YbaR (Trm112 family)